MNILFPQSTNYVQINEGQSIKQSLIIPDDIPHLIQGTNGIATTRSSIATFIPKNLIKQLTEPSNLYFIFIGILQIIPLMTYTQGVPIVYMPLTIVIIAGMIKDALEELQRFKSDRKENNQEVTRYDQFGHLFHQKKWKDIQQGDIIQLHEGSLVPCDIIILSCSSDQGVSFIETKSIDGETNLKPKYSISQLQLPFHEKNIKNYEQQSIKFSYDPANQIMNRFNGSFQISGIMQVENISHTNFIERGCVLQNTDWIIGLCIYTGMNCKIMLNSAKPHLKKSKLELLLKKSIIITVSSLFGFCVIATIYNMLWSRINFHKIESYIHSEDYGNIFNETVIHLGLWFSLLSNFIPISLLINLEVVKYIQGILLEHDLNLKCNDQTAVSNQTNLMEQLGYVDFVFSDKTGTLTQNKMTFKQLITLNDIYEGVSEIPNIQLKQKGQDFKQALLCMSLCHTVVLSKEGKMMGISPDEIAFLQFCSGQGYEFQGIDNEKVISIMIDQIRRFKVEVVFEFSSSLKRMTMIVKDLKNDNYKILSKGADEIILPMLRLNENDLELIQQNLKRCSREGWRTLVLGGKTLSLEQFQKLKLAIDSLNPNDENTSMKLQQDLEIDLEFYGITAVEDLLAPLVAETILLLKQADIKIWVLTGDKLETAMSIGFSTKLIEKDSKLAIFDQETQENLDKQMQKFEIKGNNFVLVINGQSLALIQKSLNLETKFISLALKAKCVIICRLSPKQKQQVVYMVKNAKPLSITLAIGDGANDVSMITEASIGIGIQGVEGSQAARAADFSVPQFHMLNRLLFYHGAECARKNSILLLYIFYKNQVFIFPYFCFGIFNGFSGQYLYSQLLSQLYNLIFTLLPQLLYSLFDEVYPSSKYLQYKKCTSNFRDQQPQIYLHQRLNPSYSTRNFLWWIINGMVQGFIILLICLFILENHSSQNSTGQQFSIFETGTVVYGATVLVSNLKICTFTHTFYPFTIIVILGEVLLYTLLVLYLSSQVWSNLFDYAIILYKNLNFYIINIILVCITFLFDLGYERFLRFNQQEKITRKIILDVEMQAN